jgi:hypothetical protein
VLFLSTTAGLYENGPSTFAPTNGTIANTVAYETNDGSPASYGIVFAQGAAGDNFNQGQNYFYKMSVLYDGFQESPLNQFYFQCTPSQGLDTVIGTVYIKKPPTRATHVLIYRKNSADEYYRLVKEIKLDSAWIYDEATDIYSGSFVDSGYLGATYEAVTGISEVLRDTSVNYAISTSGNNCLIVADVKHPDIVNGDHFVIKSKPGTWSIFDWSADYCTLPNKPTTIKFFAGRIFAWDRANMHKIGFQNMSIEDSYEGIGCLGEEAVVVTDLGMFFADTNNIYKHDGNVCQTIGDPILRSSLGLTNAYAWQDIVHQTTPQLLYDADKQSILVCFEHTGGVYKAWSFNVQRVRWDLIDIPKPKATILGQYGEAFLSDGQNLLDLQSSTTGTKKWSYWSRNQDFGQRGLEKKFYNVKVVCDSSAEFAKGTTEIYQDGTEISSSGSWGTQSSDTLADIERFTLTPTSRDTYATNVRLTDHTTEVDAITFIWKAKTVK